MTTMPDKCPLCAAPRSEGVAGYQTYACGTSVWDDPLGRVVRESKRCLHRQNAALLTTLRLARNEWYGAPLDVKEAVDNALRPYEQVEVADDA